MRGKAERGPQHLSGPSLGRSPRMLAPLGRSQESAGSRPGKKGCEEVGWEQKEVSGSSRELARSSVQRREGAQVGAQGKGPAVGRRYGRGSEEMGEGRDNVKNGPCWALAGKMEGELDSEREGKPGR